jgi:IS30 family transposase
MGRPRQLTRLGRDRVLAVIKAAPSQAAAARELGVHESTVSRWAKRQGGPRLAPAGPQLPRTAAAPGADAPQTYAEWVEDRFELNRSEREILRLAQQALDMSRDPTVGPNVRLQAGNQFERLVRALRLPKEEDHGHPEAARFPRRA